MCMQYLLVFLYTLLRHLATARSPSAGLPKAPGHTLRIHLRLEKRQQLFVIFKMAGTAEINDSRLVFDWMIFLLLWIDKNGLKRL